MLPLLVICFFFQAEAGIRDDLVTGVQTCALPIRAGYDADLDAIADASRSAREWIAKLEASERKRTAIKSLKVGFNKVFGYYIEVSHANTGLLPADYVRKQTLTGAERYITPELKEKEPIVLSAQEKIAAREL